MLEKFDKGSYSLIKLIRNFIKFICLFLMRKKEVGVM